MGWRTWGSSALTQARCGAWGRWVLTPSAAKAADMHWEDDLLQLVWPHLAPCAHLCLARAILPRRM